MKANAKTVLQDKTPGVWGIIKVTLPRGLFKEMNKIRAKEFKRHTNKKYRDIKVKQEKNNFFPQGKEHCILQRSKSGFL